MIFSRRAMTLIEVVIALAIFAIISVFTISSTTVGIDVKRRIESEHDYYHELRIVLRTMNRDISLAFHNLYDTSFANELRAKKEKQPTFRRTQEKPKTFFIGSRDKLFFTSSTHRRIYKDTNETDTCKVSYYLSPDDNNPELFNLVKTETGFIDRDMDYKGAEYILASRIESMTFRYFSHEGATGDGTWVDSWDSTQGERMHTFPMAVEVRIAFAPFIPGASSMEIVELIRIISPNNFKMPSPESPEQRGG